MIMITDYSNKGECFAALAMTQFVNYRKVI